MKFILEYNSFDKVNDPLSISEDSIQIPLIELQRTHDAYLLQWISKNKKRKIWIPQSQIIEVFDGPSFLPKSYNVYVIRKSFYDKIESNHLDKENYKFFSEFAKILKVAILKHNKNKNSKKQETLNTAIFSLLGALSDEIEITKITDKKIITDKGEIEIIKEGKNIFLKLSGGSLLLYVDIKNSPFLKEIQGTFMGTTFKEKRKTPYLFRNLFKKSLNIELNDFDVKNLLNIMKGMAKKINWEYDKLPIKERKEELRKKEIMDIAANILKTEGKKKEVEEFYKNLKK